MSHINAIAEDKTIVLVRPSLNKITGSFLASALLSQILYWWNKNGKKPFYKFKESCSSEFYRQGDSWTEELGITSDEFDGALRNIAYSSLWKSNKFESKEKAFIVIEKDIQRRTFYTVNESVVESAFESIFGQNMAKPEKQVWANGNFGSVRVCAVDINTKTENNSDINNNPISPKGEIVNLIKKARVHKLSVEEILSNITIPPWVVSDFEANKFFHEWLKEHQSQYKKAYKDIERSKSAIDGFFKEANAMPDIGKSQLKKAWEGKWHGLYMPSYIGFKSKNNSPEIEPATAEKDYNLGFEED